MARRKTTTPKRPAPGAPTNSTPKRSKLAKENNITADQERLILDTWSSFRVDGDDLADEDVDIDELDVGKEGAIRRIDVEKLLVALNICPTSRPELDELLDIFDSDDKIVTYPNFLAVAALQMNNKSATSSGAAREAEIEAAFKLFTRGRGDGVITLQDLRAVARVLKEDVDDEVLKAMILEANRDGGQRGRWQGGVGREELGCVLERAGVLK